MSVGGLVWGLFGGMSADRRDSDEKAGDKETGSGDDEPADWVCVLTVYNPVEARIGAARLNDEGIPCRIRQEAASSAIPVSFGMLGAMHLFVPEPNEEQAVRILQDTLDLPDEEDDED